MSRKKMATIDHKHCVHKVKNFPGEAKNLLLECGGISVKMHSACANVHIYVASDHVMAHNGMATWPSGGTRVINDV